MKASHPQYSLGEEIANAVSHGIGIALSITGLIFLVLKGIEASSALAVTAGAIFGATLILLYTASTLYHSIPKKSVKPVLRRLDHIAIYLLIAGTYTPFMLVGVGGAWGWSILGTIWGLALAGFVFKIFFIGRWGKTSTAIYVFMGWLCVIAIKPMLENLPSTSLWLLAAGGLFYTSGVIFYGWKKLPYSHAIWHLFVLGGSVCHYFAVMHLL